MKIMVGFSSHRVEALKFMEKEMERHDFILLEEPPNRSFKKMLGREIDVDEYIERTTPEFPLFFEHACEMYRGLYRENKEIRQVEPYLQVLEEIYALIEKEKPSPGDILRMPSKRGVYLHESRATAALIKYYQGLMQKDFDLIVGDVMAYAMADARRNIFREKMRASLIADKIRAGEYRGRICVEAGYIHLPLFAYIKQATRGLEVIVKPVFLLEEPTRRMAGAEMGRGMRMALSPGDILTRRYMCGKKRIRELEELLAARSIIYVKLLSKDEKIPSTAEPYPHTAEEIRLISYVRELGYEDCRELFQIIQFLKREEALKLSKKFK